MLDVGVRLKYMLNFLSSGNEIQKCFILKQENAQKYFVRFDVCLVVRRFLFAIWKSRDPKKYNELQIRTKVKVSRTRNFSNLSNFKPFKPFKPFKLQTLQTSLLFQNKLNGIHPHLCIFNERCECYLFIKCYLNFFRPDVFVLFL